MGTTDSHMLEQCTGLHYTLVSPFILGGPIISGVLIDGYPFRHVRALPAATIGFGYILIWLSLAVEEDTRMFDKPIYAQSGGSEVFMKRPYTFDRRLSEKITTMRRQCGLRAKLVKHLQQGRPHTGR